MEETWTELGVREKNKKDKNENQSRQKVNERKEEGEGLLRAIQDSSQRRINEAEPRKEGGKVNPPYSLCI